MTNFVQGVQGVVQGAVQGLSPRVPYSVQGVQGFPLHDARDTFFITLSYKRNSSRVYTHPAHPAHPAHTTNDVACRCAGVKHAPCTPCTPLIYYYLLKKMEEEREIVCGPDNTASFKKELRAAFPGFFSFAKILYDAGMIQGLRGVKLTTGIAQGAQVNKTRVKQQEKRLVCGGCIHFRVDKVGNGTGVGKCVENRNPKHLKNPMTEACDQYRSEA